MHARILLRTWRSSLWGAHIACMSPNWPTAHSWWSPQVNTLMFHAGTYTGRISVNTDKCTLQKKALCSAEERTRPIRGVYWMFWIWILGLLTNTSPQSSILYPLAKAALGLTLALERLRAVELPRCCIWLHKWSSSMMCWVVLGACCVDLGTCSSLKHQMVLCLLPFLPTLRPCSLVQEELVCFSCAGLRLYESRKLQWRKWCFIFTLKA